MASRKKTASLQQVADAIGLSVDTVRSVLRESASVAVERGDQDKIFQTARKLGYDFRKLKIGKRLQNRKETLDEVLEKIGDHQDWSRADIVKYLKESLELLERVHKRVFREEYGG